MSTSSWRVVRVEQRAREILGDRTAAWMKTPSRTLSGLTPYQLAETSEAGAHVVLTELDRNEAVLRYMARRGSI
jgi:uncharacterized protein (DUF2384 family)